VINPNTGNNLSRTEKGPVLLQATHLFLNQTNVIDWGKKDYAPGENGGISGIVFYATTRAENDPMKAIGDGWEPGIPRVQVNLYLDNVTNETGLPGPDGIPDDVNRNGRVNLSDADNYPFRSGRHFNAPPGRGDIDRNRNKRFDTGDAINIVWTDSWDDDPPRGCIQPRPIVHRIPIKPCADTFATWNQVRPGVFDGGYAFTSYFVNAAGKPVPFSRRGGAIKKDLPPGTYIVEVIVPPGYELVKEEDKNVDIGDPTCPALVTPPVCVS
jgi:hypothetical protein